MKLLQITSSVLAAALAACGPESQGPTATDDAALAAQSSGGSRTVYAVSVTGDFALPIGAPAPRVTRSSSDPFSGSDIVLKDVSFRIGAVDAEGAAVGPNGDATTCAGLYLNANTTNGGVWPTGWNGNAGTWTGGATLTNKNRTFNLRGTRQTASGTESVQSTSAYVHDWQQPAKTNDGGVWSLTFANALQYFGGNGGTTHYDAKYRCVSFTITLTPVQ